MLEVRSLHARYGSVLAVRGIDLDVEPGEIVALIGPNGAGKSTTLRSIMGQHSDRGGRICVAGTHLGNGGAVAAARAGISIVPQGRRLFPSLTVDEHMGIATARATAGAMSVAELLRFFPGLDRRRKVRAGALSGGEQQMLAIARATLLGPRYVLMDESSEGLAPSIVENVALLVEHLPTLGIGVLVTDQGDGVLVRSAGRRYEMDRGAIIGGGIPARAVRSSSTESKEMS